VPTHDSVLTLRGGAQSRHQSTAGLSQWRCRGPDDAQRGREKRRLNKPVAASRPYISSNALRRREIERFQSLLRLRSRPCMLALLLFGRRVASRKPRVFRILQPDWSCIHGRGGPIGRQGRRQRCSVGIKADRSVIVALDSPFKHPLPGHLLRDIVPVWRRRGIHGRKTMGPSNQKAQRAQISQCFPVPPLLATVGRNQLLAFLSLYAPATAALKLCADATATVVPMSHQDRINLSMLHQL
jgi:hypothetical protein